MTALAVIAFIAVVVVMVAIAAPQARSGCPGGQHVAVTGHTAVVIGSRTVTVPVYGCKP